MKFVGSYHATRWARVNNQNVMSGERSTVSYNPSISNVEPVFRSSTYRQIDRSRSLWFRVRVVVSQTSNRKVDLPPKKRVLDFNKWSGRQREDGIIPSLLTHDQMLWINALFKITVWFVTYATLFEGWQGADSQKHSQLVSLKKIVTKSWVTTVRVTKSQVTNGKFWVTKSFKNIMVFTGHPSKYWPAPKLLNLTDPFICGASNGLL